MPMLLFAYHLISKKAAVNLTTEVCKLGNLEKYHETNKINDTPITKESIPDWVTHVLPVVRALVPLPFAFDRRLRV
ncbi:hypothetical protein Y032_0477g2188 [Ancylostoma ceylanicum]|uniref:Uncharacterized protein n=1 Tax=Ancylostoma ceylanicum TaxID=53326 RepID=A0A016WXF0_9BILA|nr:hypothetical protein Y032_0477g2188 [Ancylostoma ceylanicum]